MKNRFTNVISGVLVAIAVTVSSGALAADKAAQAGGGSMNPQSRGQPSGGQGYGRYERRGQAYGPRYDDRRGGDPYGPREPRYGYDQGGQGYGPGSEQGYGPSYDYRRGGQPYGPREPRYYGPESDEGYGQGYDYRRGGQPYSGGRPEYR